MRIFISFVFYIITININSFGNGVEFLEQDGRIDVIYNGQLVTSYLTDPALLKPCLYPVKSPSGETITRAYPFKDVEGESKDHPHHTGLYFTYGTC